MTVLPRGAAQIRGAESRQGPSSPCAASPRAVRSAGWSPSRPDSAPPALWSVTGARHLRYRSATAVNATLGSHSMSG